MDLFADTSAEALGELLGDRNAPSIEALRVWQTVVLSGNPDAEFEYLALDEGPQLWVPLPSGVAWKVVRLPTHLAFYCGWSQSYGEPVIPMGTIVSADARRALEMEKVHITHGNQHLRGRLMMAFESAEIRAAVGLM